MVAENGTRKTTLLRILAGDLRPDAGTIAVGGRPGDCPQMVVLDEAHTVDQHVRYFQAAYGTGSPARAAELIERLGFARLPEPAGLASRVRLTAGALLGEPN